LLSAKTIFGSILFSLSEARKDELFYDIENSFEEDSFSRPQIMKRKLIKSD